MQATSASQVLPALSAVPVTAVVPSAARQAVAEDQLPLDAWSALIAAAMAPDQFIVIERNGELSIDPAQRYS